MVRWILRCWSAVTSVRPILHFFCGSTLCFISLQLHRELFSYRFSVFPGNFTMIYKKIEKIGCFKKSYDNLKSGPEKMIIMKIFRKFRKNRNRDFFDFQRNFEKSRKSCFRKFSKFSKFSQKI